VNSGLAASKKIRALRANPDGTWRSPRSISLDPVCASVTTTSARLARWVQSRPVRRSSTENMALDVFTFTTSAAFVSASWLSSATALGHAKRRVMVPNTIVVRVVVNIQVFPVNRQK